MTTSDQMFYCLYDSVDAAFMSNTAVICDQSQSQKGNQDQTHCVWYVSYIETSRRMYDAFQSIPFCRLIILQVPPVFLCCFPRCSA